jgi:hypothetical protein
MYIFIRYKYKFLIYKFLIIFSSVVLILLSKDFISIEKHNSSTDMIFRSYENIIYYFKNSILLHKLYYFHVIWSISLSSEMLQKEIL